MIKKQNKSKLIYIFKNYLKLFFSRKIEVETEEEEEEEK